MKEHIAYEGELYTVEWYFNERGESESLKYFAKLSSDRRKKVLYLFKRMGDFGRISDITKFRPEGNSIYAFKPQPDRFLSFFFVGKKIIITNAFVKKSQKLPKNELEKAIKIKKDFQKRIKDETYYE